MDLADSEVFQTSKTFWRYGWRQSRQREQRGQDLKYEVDVDLREAYTGVKKKYLLILSSHVMSVRDQVLKVEVVLKLVVCGGQEEPGLPKDFLQ